MGINSRLLCCSVLLICGLALAGCGSNNRAPVHDLERPALTTASTHIVSRGETLYSIAWRYGLDFRQLATINGISSPYLIRVGQTLNLKAGASRPTASSTRSSATSSTSSQSSSRTTTTARPATTTTTTAPVTGWRWPVASGRSLSARFDGTTNKGIDIRISQDSQVLAAAAGEVVYAGTGLKSYGNLVIIKHNETYLSAYANNSSLNVSEGEQVKSGQAIARISAGSSLHFEIRKQGQPVNPLTYLPN